MPRPLVFGNGSLLICLDERYAIRDLFWPTIGQPNHLNGHMIRMGVWVAGGFSWCDDAGWVRELRYKPGTLVGRTTLHHAGLGLELHLEECVDPLEPMFVRRISVSDLTGGSRMIKLFFTHDLRIDQSDVGDTAFYNPFVDGVVHYKGHHYFLFGGASPTSGVREYATGIKAFGGMEGTWRDAEDGHLSGNPIAQGSVDSTLGIEARTNGSVPVDVWYWIICGENLDAIQERYQSLLTRGPERTLEETRRYHAAWLQRSCRPGLAQLPEELVDLFRQSLLIMYTQIDDAGAILAANDTDIMETNRATYSYMWPRDGAFVSSVFDRIGYGEIARRFFAFCKRILPKDRPILLQKYGSDGSLGASWHPWVFEGRPEVPFQEDETALTISAMWEYYARHREIELLVDLWGSFIYPAATYLETYRNNETGLPLPSYDLWEERRGVHCWTVASVIRGLSDASLAATEIGEDGAAATFRDAAERMTDALLEQMFDKRAGTFVRRVELGPDGQIQFDTTPDASVLSVLLMGVVPPEDPRARSTVRFVEQQLSVNSRVGGIARYQGDYYFRRSEKYPGNPWVICTLWLAQAKLMLARKEADLKEPLAALKWAHLHAAATGALPEQVHPETGAPLSVSPLTWSHAEYVKTVLDYLDTASRLERERLRRRAN